MTATGYRVAYRLHLVDGRYFCGAGVGASGVQRMVLRDVRGRPFIPGSHIEGVVRQRCEDLLETLGAVTPSPHDPSIARADTLVTRLFGRPGPFEMTCTFSDVRYSSEPPQTVVRAQVKLNRRLGRPEHNALFHSEYVIDEGNCVTGDGLAGEICYWGQPDGGGVAPEVTLLCAGLRLVDAVGGAKTSGAGAVRVTIDKIVQGDQECALGDVLAPLGDVSWLSSSVGATI